MPVGSGAATGVTHWFLYVYLGVMGTIDVPGNFATKDACLDMGREIIDTYKEYHPQSAGFFWCVPGGNDGTKPF